jgi:DNA-binding transcriptional regulator YhcF (GntR family)
VRSPAGRRATVRDIAAETRVSIATVSRVLNDQAPAGIELVIQRQATGRRAPEASPGREARSGAARDGSLT